MKPSKTSGQITLPKKISFSTKTNTKIIDARSALEHLKKRCSQRELCQFDIYNKLKEFNIYGDQADQIVVELISNAFIDEQRYAKAFANDKVNLSSWGKSKIKEKLHTKKISPFNISAALNQIDSELYQARLRDLIKVKSKTIKAKNKFDKKAKLLRFLNSRGFTFHEYAAFIKELNF